MNVFDKICAAIAALLGVVLVALGVLGAFVGCRFWFTLPPIVGALPALAGWGIVRSVWFGWKYKKPAVPTALPTATAVAPRPATTQAPRSNVTVDPMMSPRWPPASARMVSDC